MKFQEEKCACMYVYMYVHVYVCTYAQLCMCVCACVHVKNPRNMMHESILSFEKTSCCQWMRRFPSRHPNVPLEDVGDHLLHITPPLLDFLDPSQLMSLKLNFDIHLIDDNDNS